MLIRNIEKFTLFSLNLRRIIIIFHDAFFVFLSYYLAYVLRFESFTASDFKSSFFIEGLLVNSILQLITLILMGVYRGLWRFSSTSDLLLIIKSVFFAISVSSISTFFLNRLEGTPRSIYLIDALLLIVSLGGGRFTYRILRQKIKEKKEAKDFPNAILIGAGIVGEQLVREFKKNSLSIGYNISCILDDDIKKIKTTIHGIKVVGKINELLYFQKKFKIERVFIAIPSISNQTLREIYTDAKEVKAKVHILPPLEEFLSGKIIFKQMKEIQIEDLIGRSIIGLNCEKISNPHKNKTILVTGAGGSIGSELCRQIIGFSPLKLIMVENNEYNIYKISEDFMHKKHQAELIFIPSDVSNEKEMDFIFKKYRPDMIYHAAAYKHVSIMEENPYSAIKTNVIGTSIVSELAVKYSVSKFVLISTDKAVNPTNVMGATKRVAEMICEKQNLKKETVFGTVRFGNVLNSSGSVIPKFKKQIENGGPVTITHPEVTRFFMTIPEASELVIQAGCLAKGGEVFVLEMGKSIKIVDLAKELIIQAGYKVDTEIEIEYIGLKEGEKLYEEVLSNQEKTIPTSHSMVRVAKIHPLPSNFDLLFSKIIRTNIDSSKNEIKLILKEIVREYSPRYKSTNIKNEVIY